MMPSSRNPHVKPVQYETNDNAHYESDIKVITTVVNESKILENWQNLFL